MEKDRDVERKIVAILNILKDSQKPLGSRIISRGLKEQGIDLTERAVRYHLRITDERGLTESHGIAGRVVTEEGIEEANNALVSDKVGMIIGKVDALSHLTTFDIETQSGDIILNVSLIPKEHLKKALELVKETFDAKLGFTNLLAIAHEGETLGGLIIPKEMAGLGTVCSLTINGILLNNCIPIYSKFSGILQVENYQPMRFTELIYYDASSLDPAEIFIKSKMTDVRGAIEHGSGEILAGFREFPAVCLNDVLEIVEQLEKIGMSCVTAIGKPSQPVLEMPV
ncbi:DUF128 domain-containing protein, partial [bacterium]|nr:DUF128 domain-containing protein [bacterium]